MRRMTPDGRNGERARLRGVRSWLGLVACALLGAMLGPVGPAAASGAAGTAAGNWREVSANAVHTCGIRNDGSAWCWGYNAQGEIGDATTTNRHTPIRIGTAADWVDLELGWDHSCALKADTTLWCWGYNNTGALGLGPVDEKVSDEPVQVGGTTVGETGWTTVSGGSGYTSALHDGSLWAWGADGFGELGDGTIKHKITPVLISRPPAASTALVSPWRAGAVA